MRQSNMYFLSLFLLTTVSLSLGQQPRVIRLPPCHQIAIDNCLKRNFFTFGRLENVGLFATSKDGFANICRSFNESLACITSHLSRCGSPVHRDLFQLATGEMQYHFYKFMCQENAQRDVFFVHSECIRDHVFATDGAIPCLNNYLLAFEHVQEASSIPGGNFSLLDWARSVCCAHQTKRSCTNKLALDNCGSEAAEAFDIFFEQIHFGFFTMLCRPLTGLEPGSLECARALPNRGQQPKGLRSSSAVSKMLVSYFPFNYVTEAKRSQIQARYRKRLQAKTASGLSTPFSSSSL